MADVEVRITGTIDPSVAASAKAASATMDQMAVSTVKLTANQLTMAAAVTSGAISLKELQRVLTGSTQGQASYAAITAAVTAAKEAEALATGAETAAEEANTAAKLNGRVVTEAMAALHEIMQGRTSRLAGTTAILTQAMLGQEVTAELLTLAFSSMGIAVIAVGAALITGVVLAVQYEQAERQLLISTVGLGAASQVTAGQLNDLSTRGLGTLKSSIHDNQVALESYTAAGVKNTDTLEALKSTTSDFAVLTGQKTKDAVSELAKAMEDPAKGALEINKQLSALGSQELEAIDTAERLGDTMKAQALLAQAVKQRDDEATAAAGDLEGGWKKLGVVASDTARLVGQLVIAIGQFDSQAGIQGALGATAADISHIQQVAADKKASAAGLLLRQGTPEGQQQTEHQEREGQVLQLIAAKQADIRLYGAHSVAVQEDQRAIEEYTHAASTLMGVVQKKLAIDALEVKIKEAQHAHQAQRVADLVAEKNAIASQSGVVESYADAAALSKGAGDVAGAGVHQPKGRKGPSDVSEWAEELHQQEVLSNNFFGDQTAMEQKFWTDKLALTVAGSKDWLAVKSKIYDADKKLARDSYDANLALLNENIEADKNNWSKEQDDWAVKLAFIQGAFGKESAEYRNAYKDFEAAEAQHVKTMREIERAGNQEALSELKSNLATARTIRDADAKEAEAQILERAKYSANPLAQIQAQVQIAAIEHQTAVQNLADLDAEQAATDKILQDDIAAAGADQLAWTKANNAKKLSDLQWANQHKALANQMANQDAAAAQKIAATWHSMIDPMVQATGSAIEGLVMGTETWHQALVSLGTSALNVVVAAIERMVEEWIVGLLTTKVAGSVTAASQVAGNVAIAGSGGVASMAAAPWPLDMGAPAFGAAMALNAAMYGVGAGFAQGTNVVPNDMIAQIHEGERIIPKADNSALMDAVSGGGGGGRSGHTFNFGDFNVHGAPGGMSPSEFKQALSDHATHVAGAVAEGLRGGFRPKYRQPYNVL